MNVQTAAPRPLTPTEWHERQEQFRRELVSVLNRYSKENDSDTPDWILADYLIGCLNAWNNASRMRDKWWRFNPWGAASATAENGPADIARHDLTKEKP